MMAALIAAISAISFSFLLLPSTAATGGGLNYAEATIAELQSYFADGSLSSRQLVEFYITRIQSLNPILNAVIEINPDALSEADHADCKRGPFSSGLHGIPVLLKDTIATRDRLNTTAGSFALLGSAVPRDAGVVKRLRSAGAIILGKASLSEWAHFRSLEAPDGWSARGGQGRNPYVLEASPCGSSSGPAISTAAGLVAAAVGTETDGSIICPSSANSVVGIKPTVGLTSRAGVVPVSPRQDSVGPIGRTVADAVALLDFMVGYDDGDANATAAAQKFVPPGGFSNFLKAGGLEGKRLGILRKGFFSSFPNGSTEAEVFSAQFQLMKEKGAILLDDLEISNISIILDPTKSGESVALLAEFKISLNAYLSELKSSSVRTLADVITFNEEHSVEERLGDFGQDIFLASEATSGLGVAERAAIAMMQELSADGLERLMMENKLDAVVTPQSTVSSVLAIGGYPGISVPAGYAADGTPFGICFGGLKGSEPQLIEIAYAYEQVTKVRKPPSFILNSMNALQIY